jgi:hypothetical protein
MMTALVKSVLNKTASCAPGGFSASDGQHSVNAVSRAYFGSKQSTSLILMNCVQYSANCGVTYVYGPPGYEPQHWGMQGNSFQPGMVSLPADYVEVFR